MSLARFFLEKQVLSNESDETFVLRLADDDAKHISVLRLKEEEHIAVIDAHGDYFECAIVGFEGKLPIVRIASHSDSAAARPYVVLAQGLAKADRFELVIRHATELGVSAFIPYASKRCVVKIAASKEQSKRERWQAILKSAAMQSGQQSIPQILPVMGTVQLAEWAVRARSMLICWEEADFTQTLHNALLDMDSSSFTKESPLVIVVGPEGGLEPTEIDILRSSNEASHVISLGSSILRTETAGIVAPALALYELGQLGGTR
ncbi:MAG: 16S rRNA (uracil(1498)-N(3))-methyltransferase [Eggerthellaceae bacterium]|nr:16S rRNA (uracil(1498)-N(3))-methyltransferase [Eggerthellaceae bacterium]